MVAGSQLVLQHSFRRRLDDAVGLGLLTLATLLSFTGIMELERYMHPVRFALLLINAVCSYRVTTRTFARVEFTDIEIESFTPFRRPRRWQYHQLAEVRSTPGQRQSLSLRFSEGSMLTIDCDLANARNLVAFLQQRAHHFTVRNDSRA